MILVFWSQQWMIIKCDDKFRIIIWKEIFYSLTICIRVKYVFHEYKLKLFCCSVEERRRRKPTIFAETPDSPVRRKKHSPVYRSPAHRRVNLRWDLCKPNICKHCQLFTWAGAFCLESLWCGFISNIFLDVLDCKILIRIWHWHVMTYWLSSGEKEELSMVAPAPPPRLLVPAVMRSISREGKPRVWQGLVTNCCPWT